MEVRTENTVTFWAIEYVRNPNFGGDSSGLLCMPLPWESEETIRAAVVIFESYSLAEAGLDHYLLWTEQRPASYRLLRFNAQELAEILERRSEDASFEHIALNPILSRYFQDTVGYSEGLRTEDFIEALKRTVSIEPE